MYNKQVSRITKDKRIDVGKFALGGGAKQETWMDQAGKVRIRSVRQPKHFIMTSMLLL